ncbi:MAG: 50S ribosomal protein L19 [Candidatus Aureabacteria bacterium]|nr:50S ribosomal protein L19 [Candidatus Auribacterota bacterium]
MNIINVIEDTYKKEEGNIPAYSIGDKISITSVIAGEGKGKRVQTFTGLLIAENGSGINKTITVRRISYGEGVEKVFPIHSPKITKIKIESQGLVRRAKLYYLRDRIGKKATKVKQKKTK